MKHIVHVFIETEWNSWEFWIKRLYRRMFIAWCILCLNIILILPRVQFYSSIFWEISRKKVLFCSLSRTLQLIPAGALLSRCIKAQIHNFFFIYQELDNLKNLSEGYRFYWKLVLPKTCGAINSRFDLLHWTSISRTGDHAKVQRPKGSH